MEIENAIVAVKEKFPFEGYISENPDAMFSVGKTVCRYLPVGASLFDFGSGPCDKTAVLSLLGYRCAAYDDLNDDWHGVGVNRKKIADFADGMGVDFMCGGDFLGKFKRDSFDMVMAHDVLEHLHDSPRLLLTDMLRMVKPEGFLFITVPNAVNIKKRLEVLLGRTNMERFESYYWYPGNFRGHVREYVKADLVSLCDFLGVDIVELHGVDHMLTRKLPTWVRPLYKMATAPFPGLKDSWLLVARKPKNWSPCTDISKDLLMKYLGYIPSKYND